MTELAAPENSASSRASPFCARHFEMLSLAVCALAALAFAAPVLPDFSHRLIATQSHPPGVPGGDQGFFLWALWWVGEAAARGVHPWFCDLQGAPQGVSLVYSTLSPLYGWLSIPLRHAGLSYIAIYNFWAILAIALLPWFALRCARELGASRAGAALAGLFFLLPPFQRDHLGVLNLVSAWWVPAIYFCCLRWHRTAAPRWAMLAALALAGCFYTDANHTFHAMALVALDAAWRLWAARGPGLRAWDRFWRNAAIAAFGLGTVALSFNARFFNADVVLVVWLVFFGAAALALARDLETQALPGALRRIAGAAAGAVIFAFCVTPFFWIKLTDARLGAAQLADPPKWKFFWSTQPLSFFVNDTLALWLCRTIPGWTVQYNFFQLRIGDMNVFPGYVFWALAIAVCVWGRPWKGGERRWLAFAGIFVLLSMGPFLRWGVENLEVPHWPNNGLFALPAVLFEGVPLLKGYRVWARMAAWAFFAATMFVALGWDRLLLRWGLARWRWALVFIVGAAVIAERTPWPAVGAQETPMPVFYEKLAHASRPLLLIEYPCDDGQFMFPQTVHGQALANQATSRRDAELEKRLQTNAFLWGVYTSGVKPAFLEDLVPPPMSDAAVRAGFLKLAPDGVVAHWKAMRPADAAQFRDICERILTLQPVYVSPEITLYGNPRRPAFLLLK